MDNNEFKSNYSTEFTAKEMELIYEFLQEYVPEENNRVGAKKAIMSIMKYDRVIFKNRILGALHKVM